jgi:ATP-dependent 26S proteasome regulatory subunit
VRSLLELLLSKIPTAENINLTIAVERLAFRPMSDTAFVVKEAGRIAVKKKMKIVNEALLLEACDLLPKSGSSKKPIGFKP